MRWLGRIAVLGAWAAGAAALAQNDLRITNLGNPAVDPLMDTHFQALAKELGAAFTSVNLTPPETLGHSAWAINIELGVITLEGVTPPALDPATQVAPDLPGNRFFMPTVGSGFENRGPLLLPSIHVRKGLPFSFEMGARVTWMDRSSIFAGMFEGKWAVNEGFAYLPDIGVRLHALRVFNTRDFELTTAGFDLGIGKQFAIGGMITLTPYGGWNLVFVGANTRKPIDFNTTRTYAESVTLPAGTAKYTEMKLLENAHNRFYAGLRFIGGIVQITGEVSYSLVGQIAMVASGITTQRSLPAVSAASVTFGLDY
jgi:hypothetical protein